MSVGASQSEIDVRFLEAASKETTVGLGNTYLNPISITQTEVSGSQITDNTK